MSKRLDILGARIFGASVCDVRKYLQPFRKCPNVWTKSPILAIMHKHKPYIIRIKACICAFCYFINFLHIFLDIFNGFGKYSLPSSHFIVSCGKSWYNLRIFTTTYGGNRCQS